MGAAEGEILGVLAGAAHGFTWSFRAMGTTCEVLVDTQDPRLARRLGVIAETEARRIEAKYSRYRPESLLSRINASQGAPFSVDGETGALLDYAARCHALSDGRFDITSGVLRRAWTFDGSDRVPTANQIAKFLRHVGWRKVRWRPPVITLQPGMELDFGGLGKEYAVDRATLLVAAAEPVSALLNFGGDLRVTGVRSDSRPWRVAIEGVGEAGAPAGVLEISEGALATSGDARRYLLGKDGRRYGHILDPRKGRPVQGAARSVTVAAPTCMEAGLLATLAVLKGDAAEEFLDSEGVKAWCLR